MPVKMLYARSIMRELWLHLRGFAACLLVATVFMVLSYVFSDPLLRVSCMTAAILGSMYVYCWYLDKHLGDLFEEA
jgi:hypothetical protein